MNLNRIIPPEIRPLGEFEIARPERLRMKNGMPLNIIRAGSQDGTKGVSYSENRRGFLVTTNTFSQVVNNMAARVGAGAAIVLILLFLILRKRKKDQANAA